MVTLGECLKIRDRQKDYSQKEQNKRIVIPPWEGARILVVHSHEIHRRQCRKLNILPARVSDGRKLKGHVAQVDFSCLRIWSNLQSTAQKRFYRLVYWFGVRSIWCCTFRQFIYPMIHVFADVYIFIFIC